MGKDRPKQLRRRLAPAHAFGKIVGRIVKGSEFVEAAQLLLVIEKFGRRDRDVVEMLILEMLETAKPVAADFGTAAGG